MKASQHAIRASEIMEKAQSHMDKLTMTAQEERMVEKAIRASVGHALCAIALRMGER